MRVYEKSLLNKHLCSITILEEKEAFPHEINYHKNTLNNNA